MVPDHPMHFSMLRWTWVNWDQTVLMFNYSQPEKITKNANRTIWYCLLTNKSLYQLSSKWPLDHPNGGHLTHLTPEGVTEKTPKKVTGKTLVGGVFRTKCSSNFVAATNSYWAPSSKGWVHASVQDDMTFLGDRESLNLNLHFLLLMGWGVRCNAGVFVYYIKLAVLWYSLMNILESLCQPPWQNCFKSFVFRHNGRYENEWLWMIMKNGKNTCGSKLHRHIYIEFLI